MAISEFILEDGFPSETGTRLKADFQLRGFFTFVYARKTLNPSIF